MHDTRRLAGQHSRQQVRLQGLSFFFSLNSTHCTPLPYPPINLSWWSRQVEAKPPLLQQASLITDGKCANYLSVTVMVGKLWGGSCLLERYEILIQAAYMHEHMITAFTARSCWIRYSRVSAVRRGDASEEDTFIWCLDQSCTTPEARAILQQLQG